MNPVKVAVTFGSLAILLMIAVHVSADEATKLTIFTFSAPVEVPGVALPAGTYAFRLADNLSDRQIVQVFDKDRQHLYATVLGVNDYTPQPSDKTIIRFSETTAGGPPAVKEWFYPGDQYGVEFVYPKDRAKELAKESNQPVPSIPSNMASDITDQNNTNMQNANMKALEQTPIKAEEPNGNEVELQEIIIAVPSGAPTNTNTQHDVNND